MSACGWLQLAVVCDCALLLASHLLRRGVETCHKDVLGGIVDSKTPQTFSNLTASRHNDVRCRRECMPTCPS
jgi:hypothetical protein